MSRVVLDLPATFPEWWTAEFKNRFTGHTLLQPDITDEEALTVDYVVTWAPQPSSLTRYKNIRAIFLGSAGVEHILKDTTIPDVPLYRLIDPDLADDMSEYVILQVLRHHRQTRRYEAQQRDHAWKKLPQVAGKNVTVGIMGFGALGGDAAHKLAVLGFQLIGWSRTAKSVTGIECFTGLPELETFLSRCSILICFLPVTPATRGILNARTLALLPEGSFLINVSRGAVLVENDLLDALSSGHLAGAALDVFQQEPLPQDHPFWDHPAICVTPHIAAVTHPRFLAPYILENIARLERGDSPIGKVERGRGY